MNIEKTILQDKIPGLYAVGDVWLEGGLFYGAASEDPGGPLYLINSKTKESFPIKGGPGGVMAIVNAAEENAMFCIEEFYPVFQSATAKITRVELGKCADGYQMAARRIVAEVPYVHRIAQLREPDGTYIAAGRLCKSKTEPEDWSASGTMEIGAYHRGETQILMEQIQDGVNKHHAMFVKETPDGYDDLYFGGAEGVFRSYRQNGAWRTEQLIDVPASDIVVWDLDGDGQEELAVIEGFHGNKAVLFKDLGHGYERMLEYELNFGHVLWGGSFLGRPALITGSRGGEKELILRRFRPTENGGIQLFEKTIIDAGQAPAQILVHDYNSHADIIAANHGARQLVFYHCQE